MDGGTDWTAVAGILGTLAGAGLGSWITYRTQYRAFKHQDKTRFHEHRLSAYAQYNGAANGVIAEFILSGRVGLEHRWKAVSNFETLRLIASAPVIEAATVVHRIIVEAGSSTPPDRAQLPVRFDKAVKVLIARMRAELGTTEE